MEDTTKTFDKIKANNAQVEYCSKNSAPHFAPFYGQCWRCKQNIYEEIGGRGISVEKAGAELITGCPHCNYSYVD